MNQEPLSVSSRSDSPNQKIISQILSEVRSRFRLDLSQDPVAMERIEGAVQKAIQDLEVQNETVLDIPFLSANPAGPIHLNMVLTRNALGLEPLDQDLLAGSPDREEISQPSPAEQTRLELPDRKPFVTPTLLVVNIILYLLQIVTDLYLGRDLPAALGMKVNELILGGQYWRLITPMFLHGSFIHLGFNMYALNILGDRVERLFGHFRFLGLYLVAGITGNVFSFFFTTAPSLGSSTAIFGLLGAEAIFIYQHRELFGEQFQRALRQIIQVAGINLLIGLSPGIDNWGHIGGLVGGAIFTWFGGPLISVVKTPSLLKLEDKSSSDRSLITFFLQLLVLVGLVVAIVSLK